MNSELRCFENSQNLQLANKQGFIENKGQWPEEVLFMANTKSLRVWITKNSMKFEQFDKITKSELDKNSRKLANAIELKFVDGKINNLTKSNEIGMNINFIKNKSIINKVKMYETLKMSNIWDGVDFEAYFDKGEFRYDFIVQPKINPDIIKLKINGTKSNKLINKDLILETSLKDIVKSGLTFYQLDSKNDKEIIDGTYQINNNILGFDIEKYDTDKILIIDPIVKLQEVFYSGDNSNEILTDLDYDSSDNAIFCGYTNSPTFPANLGTYTASYDIIVGSKDFINNTHNWITFLGGSSDDFSGELDVADDYIYISGVTESNDFPLQNENYSNLIGQRSNFVVILDLSCENLMYSSFLGNTTSNQIASIKVIDDDIVVSGSAESNQSVPFYEYKAISNQNRTISPSTSVGFITCLENSGNWQYGIKYSTLFGGYSTTELKDLDFDTNGNLYITGVTKSDNISFAPTQNSYDNFNTLGTRSNFISKISFDSNNLNIDYNSFFGVLGSDTTDGSRAILFHNDTIFIGGFTSIDSIPMKISFDSTYHSLNHKGFISAFKFNSQIGNDLLYSSYIGGDVKSSINDLDFDEFCNSLLFVGSTNSELTNYYGLLENNFTGNSNISNIMVGAVSINDYYAGTLKELSYLSDSLDLYGNAIRYSHAFKMIIAGGYLDNTSDFDVALFNLSKSICIEDACPCPASSQYWLSVIAENRDGLCDSNQCYVTHYLEIPEVYNCFNIIEISTIIDSTEIINNGKFNLNNFNLQSLDRCLDEGELYEISIKLYQNEYDSIPCIINQSAFCNKIYPCTPDYEDVGWESKDPETIPLPQCNDCSVSIKWVQREAGGYNDFQILSLALEGSDCDSYPIDIIYKWALGQFIAKNSTGFPPTIGSIGCDYQARVNIGGCFGVWEYYKLNDTHIDTIKVWENCGDSACCWQLLKICRDSSNAVTITPDTTGNYTSLVNCSYIWTYNQYGEQLPCIFACNWNANLEGYFEMYWPYSQKASIFEDIKKSDVYGFQIVNNVENLNIKIKSNTESNMSLKLFDINGNQINTSNWFLIKGENNILIDNKKLLKGIYLYSIEINGSILKTGKFIK